MLFLHKNRIQRRMTLKKIHGTPWKETTVKIVFELLEMYMIFMIPIFLLSGSGTVAKVHSFNVRLVSKTIEMTLITPVKHLFNAVRGLRAAKRVAPEEAASNRFFDDVAKPKVKSTKPQRIAPVADLQVSPRQNTDAAPESSGRVVQFRRPASKPASIPVPEEYAEYPNSEIPPDLDPSSGFQVVMEKPRRRHSDNDDYFIH